MAPVAPFGQAMISSMSIILLTITTGTQFTSQRLMWATMGARKQDQLEANLKLALMSIWSLFTLDTNTSTCGLPSTDSWRPELQIFMYRPHACRCRSPFMARIHG